MNSQRVGPDVQPARRVAVLWEYLAGYIQAALRELASRDGTEVLVVQRSREENASYALALGPGCRVVELSDRAPAAELVERIASFAPDVTLITTNKDPRYHAVAQANHRAGRLTVWGSEVPPRAWWRDAYGILRGAAGALRAYDAALVGGVVSQSYARRIGFAEDRIFQGLLTCDTRLFRPVGLARHADGQTGDWPRAFLFVGQFIPRKGLDILLDAYARYRARTTDPWELWCVGAGPLRDRLTGQAGVQVHDFMAPDACARVMGEAGAFVLPSRIDHWGVVIHEATCAGLPVIASRTSYASADLVQDGVNGFTYDAPDAERLARLLATCADGPRARQMGARSLGFSYRFDPTVFADMLTGHIPRLVNR